MVPSLLNLLRLLNLLIPWCMDPRSSHALPLQEDLQDLPFLYNRME
jgi:hypothetical protein